MNLLISIVRGDTTRLQTIQSQSITVTVKEKFQDIPLRISDQRTQGESKKYLELLSQITEC